MIDASQRPVEHHPLKPFLPEECRLLMLGSFPPERRRWSMEFFYPNFNNDMWRIMGLIFHGDRDRFVVAGERRFDRAAVEAFCTERGIGLYDTACEVRRLAGNASDKFLEVVTPTDIGALLRTVPACCAVAATGEKAAETFAAAVGCDAPAVGAAVEFGFEGRAMRFYRMPSSSRAYPLSVERKAAVYEGMLRAEGILR
ncbi:MAG TPA: uracil-DNA glycosylase family protein [Candidatus Alistipes merdipullorum]|nr:uracil-DNA glycosylase family protein [Candidatus Alistipes merdipullorum]